MSLFKKKKEDEKMELPELPSFSDMQEVKQAIKPLDIPKDAGLPRLHETSAPRNQVPAFPPSGFEQEIRSQPHPARHVLTQEISEPVTPPAAATPGYRPTPVPTSRAPIRTSAEAAKLKEPIFIKIDSFKEALSNFELIKERLIEIDELLKRLKETRLKEQDEFDSWEKEIIEIKSKVDDIDERLFSTLE